MSAVGQLGAACRFESHLTRDAHHSFQNPIRRHLSAETVMKLPQNLPIVVKT